MEGSMGIGKIRARGSCRFHLLRHTGFKVKYLAEPPRPEPATSCLTGGRSNQLNYAPAKSNHQRLPVSSRPCTAFHVLFAVTGHDESSVRLCSLAFFA